MKICTVGALGPNRNTRRKVWKPESDDLVTLSSDHKRAVTAPKSSPCAHLDAFDQRNGCSRVEAWELGDKLSRLLGQRRDTPDNEKWSGRWESNPHGRSFKAYKVRRFRDSEKTACDWRANF